MIKCSKNNTNCNEIIELIVNKLPQGHKILNKQNNEGKTILFVAGEKGDNKLISMLFEKGAKNLQTNDGYMLQTDMDATITDMDASVTDIQPKLLTDDDSSILIQEIKQNGGALSEIISSIALRGGKKTKKNKKSASGVRKIKMISDNSDSSNSVSSDVSRSHSNALSRMISNKKSQMHDKFLNKLKSMLSDKLISIDNKILPDADDNAEILKRFLYGKISEENPQLSSFDKITMLNKMSDDEISSDIKKIKNFKELIKLNKDIKQRRSEKVNSESSFSDDKHKKNKSSDMSDTSDMSDNDSTIGDITGVKQKKSKKVDNKINKSKSKK